MTCNSCLDRIPKNRDVIAVFSTPDGERKSFSLCERCFKEKIIDGIFSVPAARVQEVLFPNLDFPYSRQ